MNVQAFRRVTDDALRAEGLEPHLLLPRRLRVWTLPGGDVVRFFSPHAYRRPWGFVYTGAIGVEVPALRQWLRAHRPGGEAGIFHTAFVSWHLANEDVLGVLGVEHGEPVPADYWAGLLKERLSRIPPTLDGLVAAYRRNKEALGWLAHPHERHAWDFLLKWRDGPDASLHVPIMLPDGSIA
ncbi:MAG TPA: hypothetical protein VGB79_11415 [Allosphingosinicella sp.]|jgi:hypothetical protein